MTNSSLYDLTKVKMEKEEINGTKILFLVYVG